MAAAPEVEAEPSSDCPLRYKTWTLKVSIHCEGCKRKVKRILHAIEGVYTVDVDSKLHKVTITGNVDAQVLIRKLEKSGKHAELWPAAAPKVENNNYNKKSSKKKGKRNERQAPADQGHEQQSEDQQVQEQDGYPQEEQQHPSHERMTPPLVSAQPCSKLGVQFVNSPTCSGGGGGGGGGEVQTGAVSKLDAVNDVPAAREAAGQHGHPNGSGGSSGGGAKKKKKKKGRRGGSTSTTNAPNENGAPVPLGIESPNLIMHGCGPPPNPAEPAVNVMPPPPHYYTPHPTAGPPPAPPVYTVGYNTAHPTSTYTASYYAGPPPDSVQQIQEAVAGHMEQLAPPPLPFGCWNVQQSISNMQQPPPSDTFEMFSDENPNACSVM